MRSLEINRETNRNQLRTHKTSEPEIRSMMLDTLLDPPTLIDNVTPSLLGSVAYAIGVLRRLHRL